MVREHATAPVWPTDLTADHEIFRLKDELDQHEGSGTTFYGRSSLRTSTTYLD